MRATRSPGFTLPELVAALAVASCLLLAAASAVGDGLEAARSQDARQRLTASLVAAATRAGISGRHAVVCPSANGRTCAPTEDWSGGWIAFLDSDQDGNADAWERRLAREPATSGHVRLRTSTGRRRVTFQGNGGNAGSNLTFTLCDGRGPAKARSLILANTGRLREAPASAAAAAATCPP